MRLGCGSRTMQQDDAALDEHEALETDFFEYTPLVLTPPSALAWLQAEPREGDNQGRASNTKRPGALRR